MDDTIGGNDAVASHEMGGDLVVGDAAAGLLYEKERETTNLSVHKLIFILNIWLLKIVYELLKSNKSGNIMEPRTRIAVKSW